MCRGGTNLKMCWLHHMLLIIYSPSIDTSASWENESSSISPWLPLSPSLEECGIYLILSLELWRCNLLTCDQEFSLPGQSPPPRHCTARSPSVPDSSINQKNTFREKDRLCLLSHRKICLTWLCCVQYESPEYTLVCTSTFDTKSL